METATVMFVQFVVIVRLENTTEQRVVTAARDSSEEVSEKITRTRVGEFLDFLRFPCFEISFKFTCVNLKDSCKLVIIKIPANFLEFFIFFH